MNATGHMVVARIAWDVMTPTARAEVTRLVHNPHNPQSGKPTTSEDNDEFTAANYMDDIRPTYSSLHFDNQYIDEHNAPLDRPAEEPNSVTFFRDNVRVLSDAHSSADAKAEALRYTFHLTGDLHQPLHNVDRITTEWPKGDRGGNLFPINWQGELRQSNLHAYWDEAAGEFEPISRPLTTQGRKALDRIAHDIESQVPESALGNRVRDFDPTHWAAEGLQMAMHDCYDGIRPNAVPTRAYEEKTQHDMNEQTALAGYRLGHLVNQLFDPASEPHAAQPLVAGHATQPDPELVGHIAQPALR